MGTEVHYAVAKFYSELPFCFGVVKVISAFVKQSRPIQVGLTVPLWVGYCLYQPCEVTPGLFLQLIKVVLVDSEFFLVEAVPTFFQCSFPQ